VTAAALYGNPKTLEVLGEWGADLHRADKKGRTPLWYACRYGQVEPVHYLLTKLIDKNMEKRELNKPDIRGRTPFRKAVTHNYIDIVRLFLAHLDAKLLVHEIDKKLMATLLHPACFKGYDEVVAILIDNGAGPDANIRDVHTWRNTI
jgi:ankyrin repeat protein